MSVAHLKSSPPPTTQPDSLGVARRVLKDQAQGLVQLQDALDETFRRVVDCLLLTNGKVVLSGVGKSGHIAQKIASTLSSTGTPACFLHPAEANHGDLGFLESSDTLLILSNSGETHELVHLMTFAKQLGVPVLLMTSRPESRLAKLSQMVLALPPLPEACPMGLAPTTSTTMMLALGDALSAVLIALRGFTPEDYRDRHPGGALGRKLCPVVEVMRSLETLPCAVPDQPLHQAFHAMAQKGLRFVLVKDPVKGIGVLSVDQLSYQENPNRPLSKFDFFPLRTLSRHSILEEAREMMHKFEVEVVGIVDDDQTCIGFVTLSDCTA